ncbi:5'-methylthioadenosine/adenosylhomocysteine nucleosidase [Pigmentiphaga aceris]|uniref:adenosylhomocysteine nucleosidase n=1 Tax=Pigmentiphaga aceris TaxID=1940612 RepID=A0A5C0B1U3_9BURK|nr:5'-methylthioadenosine/adenosylhomocysteine nucleosidase [Pigmentiphaga aceris]QEI08688.1 5'-methylthioadenosine/adenosylhomocysteine nucleosidase [Pigmentiphaga aceris]
MSSQASPRRLGILAAMHDELAGLLADMGPDVVVQRVGLRDYHVGELYGHPCVLVLARIGKVAAAATTVTLIREFKVDAIVFTGLAGGIGQGVRVGDVVVGTSLVQHDMDARPIFPRHEIPLLDRAYFDTDASLNALLRQSAAAYVAEQLATDIDAATRADFGIDVPAVHEGLIASGDTFVHAAGMATSLVEALPDVLCVEMEGAAVAQICHEYEMPCAVLRTISDRADSTASVDFRAFLQRVASVYAVGIVRRFLMGKISRENAA